MFVMCLVKECEEYYYDFKDCKSIRGRFHQYFIHGHTLDCSEWKRDYESCMKYRNKKDTEALQSVISSECERKRKRLSAHFANDVWERRTEPPAEWSKPLPTKEEETSFLAFKMAELREKNLAYPEQYKPDSWCSIS